MGNDKSNLVSEIRQMLSSKRVLPELLREVAAEYNDACAGVNERLVTIHKLLAEGYRDEAIDLADQRPRLLNHLQLVDFPEREQWVDLLLNNNLSAPPHVLSAEAEQLEQAYEEQRQLAPLMRQHRLLAMSGAPLAARLKVLRRLERQDPGNPIWREDVEAFERIRLSELDAEVVKAKKERDSKKLGQVVEEIESDWTVSLPRGLKERARSTLENVVREEARANMVPLAQELNDALSAFDAERGRELRRQWERYLTDAQLAPDDELIQRTKEAMLWLAEADDHVQDEAAFGNALAALEKAMDEGAPLADFERQLYAAQKFEWDLPPALSRRAKQYHSALTVARTRKSRLLMATVAVAIILFAGSLAYFFWNRSRQAQLVDARTQMQQFRNDENYSAASTYYKALSGFVRSDPDVISTWHAIEKQHSEKQTRQAELHRLLGSVSLDGPLEQEIDQAIEQARSFATTSDDAAAVDSMAAQVGIERTSRQKERNEEFLIKLDSLGTKIREHEKTPIHQADLDALIALRDSAAALKREHSGDMDGLPMVAPTVLNQTEHLSSRIDAIEKTVAAYRAAVKQLDAISQSVGSADEFKKQLARFVEQNKSFAISPDLMEIASEHSLWETFLQWRSLANERVWDNPLSISSERAAELLAAIASIKQKRAIADWSGELSKTEVFLEALRDVKAKNSEFPAKLESLSKKYSRLEFREQKVLVDPNGTFKYFAAEPKIISDREQTWYYFWPDLKKEKQASELISDSDAAKCKVGVAGQAVVAERMVKDLSSFGGERDIESLIGSLFRTTLGRSDLSFEVPIDPIVQGVMVNEIAQIGAEHCMFWREFAETAHKKLGDLDVTLMDWMEFKNPTTSTFRRQVKAVLDELAIEFDSAASKVQSSIAQAKELGSWRAKTGYEWSGWMYLLEGTWRIHSRSPLSEQTELFILVAPRPNEPARFQLVGRWTNGSLVDVPSQELLKSGRPIFVRATSN